MSSQRGNVSRTRPQKHKNTTGFKNNLHDKTQQVQMLNKMEITGCCARCKDIIDWKIKYKKYKPLTQPRTCTMCKQKTVKRAYYLLCDPCAAERQVCAKCGDKQEIVLQPTPSVSEEHRQKAMFKSELKALSEKQRRKFLRLMAAGQIKFGEIPTAATIVSKISNNSDHESDDENDAASSSDGGLSSGAEQLSAGEQNLDEQVIKVEQIPAAEQSSSETSMTSAQ